MIIKNRTIFTGDNLHVLRVMEFGVGGPDLPGPAVQQQCELRRADRERGVQGHVDGGRRVARRASGRAAGTVPLLGERRSTGSQCSLVSDLHGGAVAKMRRVLKATGSLWLHCDHTASHYLKVLKQMTAVGAARGAIASRGVRLWHARLSLSEYDAFLMIRHTPCPSRP